MPDIAIPKSQGSMVLALDGTITHWSAGAGALYGFAPNEAVGKGLALLFPNRGAELHEAIEQVLRGGELRTERLSHRRDGSELWVDLHLTLMLASDGKPVGVLGMVQDATERRRLAAQMQRHTEMEHHLIAIVSHDLRNPLQAVILSAALGMKTTTDTRLTRLLERIKGSAERGARLIHDLLDFNRVRHGAALQVNPKRVDLSAVLLEQVDEVLCSRPERTVQLEASGDLNGEWDSDRVAQLLGNLLTNALQHTTEDVAVTVRVTGHAEHVELQVRDEGPGIAPDVRKRLFQPHVRGQVSSATGRSVGLGLFITRAIVDAHGGSVECNSEVGRGTVFTVKLPRERRRP